MTFQRKKKEENKKQVLSLILHIYDEKVLFCRCYFREGVYFVPLFCLFCLFCLLQQSLFRAKYVGLNFGSDISCVKKF